MIVLAVGSMILKLLLLAQLACVMKKLLNRLVVNCGNVSVVLRRVGLSSVVMCICVLGFRIVTTVRLGCVMMVMLLVVVRCAT